MEFKIIGHGAYSLAEAERLVNVPRQRIKRWAQGYTYSYKGEQRETPPIIAVHSQPNDGSLILDFSDLLEVRFLNVFRRNGIGFKDIRIAALRAKTLFNQEHPFSSRKFKTDGRTILAEIVTDTGDKRLLDLVKNQYAFESIVAPFLYDGFEYNEFDEPQQWWPLGRDRNVVIDPLRSFGAPIVARGGVPTQLLMSAVKAEGCIDTVAHWYEIDIQEVKDAIEYEQRLAA